MINCLIVGLGGAIGAILRYLISLFQSSKTTFPYATLVTNLIGALIIGVVAGLVLNGNINEKLTLFLKVGICGGFTTFSSFALESNNMITSGKTIESMIYIIISIIGCIMFVTIDEILVKR